MSHEMLMYRSALLFASPLLAGYTLMRAARDRNGRYLLQRLGFRFPRLEQPIWLHCASVGEVMAVHPLLVYTLVENPDLPIVVTTNTVTGERVLHNLTADTVNHAFLPLDFNTSIYRFLRCINPRSALILETELWPALYMACQSIGIPLVVINGRLSDRTLRAPAFVRRLYAQLLRSITAVLARSDADAQNFQLLGAPEARIKALGNLKFAHCPSKVETLTDPVGRPYWLAASTHDDEELRLARLWKDLGGTEYVLVIAPRHPERGAAISKGLTSDGWRVAVRSRNEQVGGDTQIYLADTLGEMPAFMNHARFVFLGGSLIERGGHNVLEPARLGKTVIVGPYMHNFAEETHALLKARGLIMVRNDEELSIAVDELLANHRLCDETGARAKAFMHQKSDIAQTYYEELQKLGVFGA